MSVSLVDNKETQTILAPKRRINNMQALNDKENEKPSNRLSQDANQPVEFQSKVRTGMVLRSRKKGNLTVMHSKRSREDAFGQLIEADT